MKVTHDALIVADGPKMWQFQILGRKKGSGKIVKLVASKIFNSITISN